MPTDLGLWDKIDNSINLRKKIMIRYFPSIYALVSIIFVIFSYLFVDINLLYFRNFYSGISTDLRLITSLSYAIFILIFFLHI